MGFVQFISGDVEVEGMDIVDEESELNLNDRFPWQRSSGIVQISGTHNSPSLLYVIYLDMIVVCAIQWQCSTRMMDCLKRVHEARWLISKKKRG